MSRGEKSLLYVFVDGNGLHFVINILIIHKNHQWKSSEMYTTYYKILKGEIEKCLANFDKISILKLAIN